MNTSTGTHIDQYRIDARIARGGMGTVYRATDLRIDRVVAIKLLHTHRFQDSESRFRFFQEARAAANLNHPSIVRVFDFRESANHIYLVMEFIEGPTLSNELRRLRQTGFTENLHETLLVLAQVAEALGYAHQMGIIHRDIKPGNIMLKPLNQDLALPHRAVVTDFGLATFQHGQEPYPGNFIGTLPFMSPEQCLGEPLDGRSDIYSLGIVLYRMTTGQLPFNVHKPADATQSHLYEIPPSPLSLQPNMPPSIAAIINRALAKRPQDRFQTAEQMAEGLRQSAEGLTDAAITQIAFPDRHDTTQFPEMPQQTQSRAASLDAHAIGEDAFTTFLPGNNEETDMMNSANALSLHINPVNVHVKPGGKSSVQVEIANFGLMADHFIMQLRHLPASWISMAQESVQLMPGAHASLPFTMHPPANSKSTVGEHLYELRLIPASNPTVSAVVRGKLIVTPLYKISMNAHPTHFTNFGVCRINVQNEGNTAVSYSISGRTATVQLIFDGEKQQLHLNPGKTDSSIIGIRPRQRHWIGSIRSHAFELELRSDRGDTQIETGRITIHPRIPNWVIPLITLFTILLLLGLIALGES